MKQFAGYIICSKVLLFSEFLCLLFIHLWILASYFSFSSIYCLHCCFHALHIMRHKIGLILCTSTISSIMVVIPSLQQKGSYGVRVLSHESEKLNHVVQKQWLWQNPQWGQGDVVVRVPDYKKEGIDSNPHSVHKVILTSLISRVEDIKKVLALSPLEER